MSLELSCHKRIGFYWVKFDLYPSVKGPQESEVPLGYNVLAKIKVTD